MNWINFSEDEYKLCSIEVFDDGYQNYKHKYDNLWYVIGTNNKGKYELKNIKDSSVKINSISSWKVRIFSKDL